MSEEDREALDPEDETIPVDPARRRLQTGIGIAVVVLVLLALLWFFILYPSPDDGPTAANTPTLTA